MGRPKGSTNKGKVKISTDTERLKKIDRMLKMAAKGFVSDYCDSEDEEERSVLKETAYLFADASASLKTFLF